MDLLKPLVRCWPSSTRSRRSILHSLHADLYDGGAPAHDPHQRFTAFLVIAISAVAGSSDRVLRISLASFQVGGGTLL